MAVCLSSGASSSALKTGGADVPSESPVLPPRRRGEGDACPFAARSRGRLKRSAFSFGRRGSLKRAAGFIAPGREDGPPWKEALAPSRGGRNGGVGPPDGAPPDFPLALTHTPPRDIRLPRPAEPRPRALGRRWLRAQPDTPEGGQRPIPTARLEAPQRGTAAAALDVSRRKEGERGEGKGGAHLLVAKSRGRCHDTVTPRGTESHGRVPEIRRPARPPTGSVRAACHL